MLHTTEDFETLADVPDSEDVDNFSQEDSGELNSAYCISNDLFHRVILLTIVCTHCESIHLMLSMCRFRYT